MRVVFRSLLVSFAFGILALGMSLSYAEDRFALEQWYWVGEMPERKDSVVWEPFDGVLALGYGTKPVWIKLSVASVTGQSPQDVIRITVRPGHLDKIELFDPSIKQILPPVGDRYPYSNNATAGLLYSFDVALAAQPRNLFLRIESSGSRLIQVDVEPVSVSSERAFGEQFASFVLLGVFVLMFAIVGYQWWILRSRLARCVFILQLVALGYGFFILGFARVSLSHYVSATTLDSISSLLVIAYAYTSIWFYIQLLVEYDLDRKYCRRMQSFLFTGVVIAALYILGMHSLALELNAYAVILGVFMLFALAVNLFVRNAPPANPRLPPPIVMLVFFSILLFFNLGGFFPLLGVQMTLLFGVCGPTYNAVLNGAFVLFLFHVRRVKTEQMHTCELQQQLIQVKAKRQEVEDLEQFIDLITHEVRSPLSMVALALDCDNPVPRLKELALLGVENIDGLLTRCSIFGDLRREGVSLINQSCSPCLMCLELVAHHPKHSRFEVFCGFSGEVMADQVLLRMVMGNLLDNAIKYGSEDVKIRVVTRVESGDVSTLVVEVTNRIGAVGVPDADQLFQRHYRAESARRFSGSGLGLYLSKRIMLLHDGDLQCEVDGQCVCFRVILPMTVEKND